MINVRMIIAAVVLLLVTAQSYADPAEGIYLDRSKELKLNAQEREAVNLAKRFRSSDDASKPIYRPDGSVLYYYGSSQPVMVCAPMEVCVIQLQPGEELQALNAGDMVRWVISPATVGTPSGIPRTDIIVKPTDVGLLSSLYIGTDKRSYHIKLKSSRTEFIPVMAFHYPREFMPVLHRQEQLVAQQRARNTIPSEEPEQDGLYIEDLYFRYRVEGQAPWRPLRVYNDGQRTIIDMPGDMSASNAPTLLVMDGDGEGSIVNYRIRKGRFIVDQIFDEAVLISGVGKKQRRVTIARL